MSSNNLLHNTDREFITILSVISCLIPFHNQVKLPILAISMNFLDFYVFFFKRQQLSSFEF